MLHETQAVGERSTLDTPYTLESRHDFAPPLPLILKINPEVNEKGGTKMKENIFFDLSPDFWQMIEEKQKKKKPTSHIWLTIGCLPFLLLDLVLQFLGCSHEDME